MFDAAKISLDFPILSTMVYGKPLIYFDNAATTQIPQIVMDTVTNHYKTQNANVHRGIHYLSKKSTMCMEHARVLMQKFVHAESPEQIVFTSGTTESVHMIAQSYVRYLLEEDDQIIVSEFEHHSNLVVWQQLCMEKRAKLIVIPEKNGTLDMDCFISSISKKTKFVSMTMVSNVTGVQLPVKLIVQYAHEAGAAICIDGAQSVRHGVDVCRLGCDFFCFSGHKMMGPAGTGVLYIARKLLDTMRPVRFGGGMVETVYSDRTTFAPMPYRLEAGTPNYPGIIGLGAAAEYLMNLGMEEISEYEKALTVELEHMLNSVEGVTVLGKGQEKYSVVSVVMKGIHPYDAASFLDKYGIAVRSGSHCAQLIVRKYGVDSVLRFSPAFYNNFHEINTIQEKLQEIIGFFQK
ncbi:aminotransferase class V-fold PLP-dependent enzyme [Schaedlerella arabinosiphila]|nr:SufS family cysteine desulfurase [Schaedlerella arabinosiphila]